MSLIEMDSNQWNHACHDLRDMLLSMDERPLLQRMSMGSIESVYLDLRPRMLLDSEKGRGLGVYEPGPNGRPVLKILPFEVESIHVLTDPARHPEMVEARRLAEERARRAVDAARTAQVDEAWQRLSPIARACHQLASRTPAMAELLRDLARLVEQETVQASARPSTWSGQ